jgi:hypothetical protein
VRFAWWKLWKYLLNVGKTMVSLGIIICHFETPVRCVRFASAGHFTSLQRSMLSRWAENRRMGHVWTCDMTFDIWIWDVWLNYMVNIWGIHGDSMGFSQQQGTYHATCFLKWGSPGHHAFEKKICSIWEVPILGNLHIW